MSGEMGDHGHILSGLEETGSHVVFTEQRDVRLRDQLAGLDR